MALNARSSVVGQHKSRKNPKKWSESSQKQLSSQHNFYSQVTAAAITMLLRKTRPLQRYYSVPNWCSDLVTFGHPGPQKRPVLVLSLSLCPGWALELGPLKQRIKNSPNQLHGHFFNWNQLMAWAHDVARRGAAAASCCATTRMTQPRAFEWCNILVSNKLSSK